MREGGEIAYVAVGANLGDREAVFAQTIIALDREPGIELRAASPVYETEPVGPAGQGAYLNAMLALEVEMTISPRELLERLQAIELSMGRDRGAGAIRWGARTLDLDLVFYGNLRLDEPGLIVPHPRAHLRAFVMRPMADLAPDFEHPELGLSAKKILGGLSEADRDDVRPYARPRGWPSSSVVPVPGAKGAPTEERS